MARPVRMATIREPPHESYQTRIVTRDHEDGHWLEISVGIRVSSAEQGTLHHFVRLLRERIEVVEDPLCRLMQVADQEYAGACARRDEESRVSAAGTPPAREGTSPPAGEG